MNISKYIEREHPRRQLMPLEWVVLAYGLFTLIMVLFTYTKLDNPQSMIWERVRLCFITVGIWVVYRLVPCRLTRLLRIVVQGALLATWYPDTYELNRVLPNLDHHFAAMDQWLFGFQPALLFAKTFPSIIVSELMDMGYASYYPMIMVTLLYYFVCRYRDFERAAWIVFASFFAYYVIYDVLPVVGPTFYYHAVGVDRIAAGVFPAVGDWFNTHRECLVSPGYTDGIFYQLVEDAKAAGERPTAAFPSSHVGISTICMLLAWHSGSRKLFFLLLPFYVFLCMATVYIQAHYLVDVIGGLATGILFFAVGLYAGARMKL